MAGNNGIAAIKLEKRSSIHGDESSLTMIDSSSGARELFPDDKASPNPQEMDDDFWVTASASQMAQHISLNGPKTQFAQDKDLGIASGEKT